MWDMLKALLIYVTMIGALFVGIGGALDEVDISGNIEAAHDNKKEHGTREEEKQYEYLDIEREYYAYIDAAIYELEDSVTNPSTLEINEIIFWCNYDTYFEVNEYCVYFDFYSSNKYGMRSRNRYSYSFMWGAGSFTDYSVYSTWRDACMGNSLTYPYRIGTNFYADAEKFQNSKKFVFIVDIDDYLNR